MLNEEAGDVESEAGEVRSLAGMVGGEKRGRGIPARAPETTREGAHAPREIPYATSRAKYVRIISAPASLLATSDSSRVAS